MLKQRMYASLGISEKVFRFGEEIEGTLKERFADIDACAEYNQLKVISAMQENKVSEACLYGTTGYGYNDMGRDTLERCMRQLSIRRMRWCAHRSPVVPTHWLWHWLPI